MSVPAPGMTTGNAANCHPAAFKQSILFESFDSIYRTTGRKPTSRTKPGRNNQLINPYQENQWITKYLQDALHIKPSPVYPVAVLPARRSLHKKQFPFRYK